MIKTNTPLEPKKPAAPPLVDLKVSNPITYIKMWWKKIIGNEGVDFRFRIHPLTAIAIVVIIASIGFGVGRFILPFSIPFFKFEETGKQSPSPTPEIWKETGFVGTLQYSITTNKYYLLTTSSEAITLEVPQTISLKDLVGKRIFAIGNYNKTTRILIVTDTKDLEILPKTPLPLPTITPSPNPVASPESTPSSSPNTY